MSQSDVSYFISRAGQDDRDTDLAREIAKVLTDAGFSTRLQDYDIAVGDRFPLEVDRLLKTCRHMIVVYSPAYDASPFCGDEWSAFLVLKRRSFDERKMIVINSGHAEPQGYLAPFVYGSMAGLSDAKERAAAIMKFAQGKPIAERPRAPITNVGGSDNSLFVGREQHLRRLVQVLNAPAGATGGRGSRVAAIHGMAGIGKSTLAVEFARRAADGYTGIWRVSADTPNNLELGLAELAQVIDFEATRSMPPRLAALQALRHVSGSTLPWLLIYDNAEGYELVYDYLPAANAHVIVTSRLSLWQGEALPLDLGELEPDAAVHFLSERSGRDEPDEAVTLARELGHLPLALSHAAALCSARGAISFKDYRARLANMLRERPGARRDASVHETIRLALEQLDTTYQRPEARQLLDVCAYLWADCIPLRLLELSTGKLFPTEKLGLAVQALTELSLAEGFTMGNGMQALRVHRLVQAVVRDLVQRDTKRFAEIDKYVTLASYVALHLLPEFSGSGINAAGRTFGRVCTSTMEAIDNNLPEPLLGPTLVSLRDAQQKLYEMLEDIDQDNAVRADLIGRAARLEAAAEEVVGSSAGIALRRKVEELDREAAAFAAKMACGRSEDWIAEFRDPIRRLIERFRLG